MARKAGAPPPNLAPSPISPPAVAEGEPPLFSSLWANFVTRVLKQCAVSVFGIRVVLDFPEHLTKAVDSCSKPSRLTARKQGGGSGDGSGVGGGVSAELFVSCVEAFAKPLEGGRAGIKLVVRIEQVRAYRTAV